MDRVGHRECHHPSPQHMSRSSPAVLLSKVLIRSFSSMPAKNTNHVKYSRDTRQGKDQDTIVVRELFRRPAGRCLRINTDVGLEKMTRTIF